MNPKILELKVGLLVNLQRLGLVNEPILRYHLEKRADLWGNLSSIDYSDFYPSLKQLLGLRNPSLVDIVSDSSLDAHQSDILSLASYIEQLCNSLSALVSELDTREAGVLEECLRSLRQLRLKVPLFEEGSLWKFYLLHNQDTEKFFQGLPKFDHISYILNQDDLLQMIECISLRVVLVSLVESLEVFYPNMEDTSKESLVNLKHLVNYPISYPIKYMSFIQDNVIDNLIAFVNSLSIRKKVDSKYCLFDLKDSLVKFAILKNVNPLVFLGKLDSITSVSQLRKLLESSGIPYKDVSRFLQSISVLPLS